MNNQVTEQDYKEAVHVLEVRTLATVPVPVIKEAVRHLGKIDAVRLLRGAGLADSLGVAVALYNIIKGVE